MEKVKISKDGASIDFIQSDKVPVSPKKFRQGAELEGFYRFIFENDLRKEALHVIDRIFLARKAMKLKKPLEALKRQAALKAQELVEKIISTPVVAKVDKIVKAKDAVKEVTSAKTTTPKKVEVKVESKVIAKAAAKKVEAKKTAPKAPVKTAAKVAVKATVKVKTKKAPAPAKKKKK